LLRPPFSRRRAHPRTQWRRDCLQSLGHGRGLSEYLWELEQPAHAVANAYFVAAINRVGTEQPWKIGILWKSYFCNPRGKLVAQASRDKDELLVAELNSTKFNRCAIPGSSIAIDVRSLTAKSRVRVRRRTLPPPTNLQGMEQAMATAVSTSQPAAILLEDAGSNPPPPKHRSAAIRQS